MRLINALKRLLCLRGIYGEGQYTPNGPYFIIEVNCTGSVDYPRVPMFSVHVCRQYKEKPLAGGTCDLAGLPGMLEKLVDVAKEQVPS